MLDPQDRASCLLSSTLARCSLSISCFFASPSSSYTRTPRCASSSRLLYSCIFPSSSRWGLRAPGPVLTWAIGEEEEDPSFDAPDRNASARLSIAVVASAAEMVPGVILQPPSDENAASVALLTPSRPSTVARPLSEGSGAASPAACPKRRCKHISPPQASPTPGGSRVTLRIPGGGQHIPSVLERLRAAEAPPQAPPSPAISVDENLARSILNAVSKSIKVQCDPAKTERTIMAILSALPPGSDVTALLPKPALGRLSSFPSYISSWESCLLLLLPYTSLSFWGSFSSPFPSFLALIARFCIHPHMHSYLLHSHASITHFVYILLALLIAPSCLP